MSNRERKLEMVALVLWVAILIDVLATAWSIPVVIATCAGLAIRDLSAILFKRDHRD